MVGLQSPIIFDKIKSQAWSTVNYVSYLMSHFPPNLPLVSKWSGDMYEPPRQNIISQDRETRTPASAAP